MKKLLFLFLAVCMIASLVACGNQAQTEAEERIGIISAMDNEVALLLKEAEIDRVDTIGGVDFHVGTLHWQPVVIMPFVVIRAMSDKADGNAHESVDNMGDLAADNSSRIVIQMMDAMRS